MENDTLTARVRDLQHQLHQLTETHNKTIADFERYIVNVKNRAMALYHLPVTEPVGDEPSEEEPADGSQSGDSPASAGDASGSQSERTRTIEVDVEG